jgi:GWxTD domain-containing protein
MRKTDFPLQIGQNKVSFYTYLYKITLCTCIVWGMFACAVSKTNLNDGKQNKTAKPVNTEYKMLPLKSKFLLKGDSLRIYNMFVDHAIETPSQFATKYNTLYSFILDYNAKDKSDPHRVYIDEKQVSVENGNVNFYFDLKKPKTDNISIYLKIDINEKIGSKKITNELALRLNSNRTADNFGLFKGDFLVTQNFVKETDSLEIRSLLNDKSDFKIVEYIHDFDYAVSPVVVNQRNAPKPLYVDTLLNMQTNTKFVVGRKVMCYFIKDTTDRSGICVLSVDSRYPKYTQATDLIKPLAYISTNHEYNGLRMTDNAKRALDQYWLSLHNGNHITAKRTIKELYNRVSEANMLFTGYKEGWKTDKGMIYMVMGNPDLIRHTRDKEIWIYTKYAKYSEVNFTFSKRSNQFIEDHFELNRFTDFQQVWFPAVESIRNGSSLQ